MSDLYIISPDISPKFLNDIKILTKDLNTTFIYSMDNLINLQNKKLLFVVELNDIGINLEMLRILEYLYKQGTDSLLNCIGAIIVKSPNELFTKNFSQTLLLLANSIGCLFIGHSIVEITSSYKNFLTWKKRIDKSLEEICTLSLKNLINNLMNFKKITIEKPKILALHSSSHSTSNTLALWKMVRQNLKNFDIEEFHVEDGTIVDCKGCPYKTCKYYGFKNKCFYGGIITKELLPLIQNSDIIIWICPNYNDCISAKLMAVINRLTVLYRKITFHEKMFFAIIVSGNSGSDCLAKQLIGSLNINKGFILYPYFYISAIANDPLSIHNVPNIKNIAKLFANNISTSFK